MKNKHLVLIFVLTLLIGLAVRRAPWKLTSFFQAELITMDTSAIHQIEIQRAQTPSLLLLRGDEGWQAEADERSVKVPTTDMQTMLSALKDMRSVQIIKTDRPDTLGLGAYQSIRLTLEDADQQKDALIIGRSTPLGQGRGCYIQLPRHLGIYLVDRDLHAAFSKSMDDFRPKNILNFPTDSLTAVTIYIPSSDTMMYQKNDSSGVWESRPEGAPLTMEQQQKWLNTLGQLHDLPFADQFDESRAAENLFAEIKLELNPETPPLNLEIYRFSALNLPEETAGKAFTKHSLPTFVLRSSQNPLNYFAVEDSLLIHQICRTW